MLIRERGGGGGAERGREREGRETRGEKGETERGRRGREGGERRGRERGQKGGREEGRDRERRGKGRGRGRRGREGGEGGKRERGVCCPALKALHCSVGHKDILRWHFRPCSHCGISASVRTILVQRCYRRLLTAVGQSGNYAYRVFSQTIKFTAFADFCICSARACVRACMCDKLCSSVGLFKRPGLLRNATL